MTPRQILCYECAVCHKRFYGENAHENALKCELQPVLEFKYDVGSLMRLTFEEGTYLVEITHRRLAYERKRHVLIYSVRILRMLSGTQRYLKNGQLLHAKETYLKPLEEEEKE